jgi:hypothetical protein
LALVETYDTKMHGAHAFAQLTPLDDPFTGNSIRRASQSKAPRHMIIPIAAPILRLVA